MRIDEAGQQRAVAEIFGQKGFGMRNAGRGTGFEDPAVFPDQHGAVGYRIVGDRHDPAGAEPKAGHGVPGVPGLMRFDSPLGVTAGVTGMETGAATPGIETGTMPCCASRSRCAPVGIVQSPGFCRRS